MYLGSREWIGVDGDNRIKQNRLQVQRLQQRVAPQGRTVVLASFVGRDEKREEGRANESLPPAITEETSFLISLGAVTHYERLNIHKESVLEHSSAPGLTFVIHTHMHHSISQELLYVVSFHSVVVVAYPQAANRLRGGKKKLIEHCFPPKTIKTKLLP